MSFTSPAAVVIALDCTTGLQSARILARRGVPVIAIAADRRHYCCRTRVCERILYGSTTTSELVETLLGIGPTLEHKAVLVPCGDPSVLVVSRHRDELAPWYHVVLPPHDVVQMLADKLAFSRFAQQHGLPMPATLLLSTREEAVACAEQLVFPVVLKPAVKSATWLARALPKASKVASGRELVATFERLSPWAEELVAQEWIEGDDASLFSCNCYFGRDGTPLATFVARKLRQWPHQTGTSSLGVEVRNDTVLAETLRLFESVGYRGLGYVEMKKDSRTGRELIVEPNVGRPTGRSSIAEAGGVELLYTAYCDAAGLPLPAAREQTYQGARWVDDRRDAQSAALYCWRRELTLREWRESWRGPKAHAVLDRGDPLPMGFELLHTARSGAAALARGLQGVPARTRGRARLIGGERAR